jgi:BirA family biotin operon repressor/biotin-[acetyl-CoA-carboxylase] ligase
MIPPFAKTSLDLKEIGSTSDLARELVLSGDLELPLVVRARRQTAGRGRGEHRWFSDDGSLTFTVAIDPKESRLRRDHEPRLALALAVEIINVVESLIGISALMMIRWPNDIESSGKKVAGLLPERVETPNGPRLLIGIGINVTTDFSNAPAEVRRMAVSINELSEHPIDADFVLESLLGRFPGFLSRLADDDPALSEEWLRRDSLLGQPVRLALGEKLVSGIGRGVDASGGLRIRSGDVERTFHAGHVLRASD